MQREGASGAIDAGEISAQLERILASPMFAGAGRQSDFLRFIVAAHLAGECGRIKEYSIGVEVYHRRAEAYDPRTDSLVRVEATKLSRRAS